MQVRFYLLPCAVISMTGAIVNCADGRPPRHQATGTAREPVLAGAETQFNSIVGITAAEAFDPMSKGYPDTVDTPLDAENYWASWCSGVLVAPNLVLTVRHCAQFITHPLLEKRYCERRFQGLTVDVPGRGFGSRYYVTSAATPLKRTDGQPPRWHHVKQVLVPEGKDTPCYAGIAALVLAVPLPGPYAVPDLRRDLSVDAPRQLTIVGRGWVASLSPGTKDDGEYRQRSGSIDFVCAKNAEGECIVADANSDGTNIFKLPAQFVAYSAGGTFGDSGGAVLDSDALARGEQRLVALHEASTSDPTDGGAAATNGGLGQRVERYSRFVREAGIEAAKIGGYAAPDW